MSNTLSPSQPGEFLIIEPEDLLSLRAFDELVRLARANQLDSHQAQYLRATGETSIAGQKLIKGHHTVGFHVPSAGSANQWRIGSGTQIDLLLAPRGNDAASLIESLHITLRMHPESGIWMVHANAPMKLDRTEIRPGESRCLSEDSTRININGLVFNFLFTITKEAEEQVYLEQRNRILRETDGFFVPDARISGIPFKSDIRFPSIVFRDLLGSGKFGAIFHGFEPQTGDMRVVKRLYLVKDHDIQLARREIRALDELQGSLGIVKMYDIRNGRGGIGIPNTAPSELFIVQERGTPFREWREPPETAQNHARIQTTQASVMYQLLAGLEAFYRKGWLHRDITRNNLLYFDDGTPRAALCDFGKVCFEITSRDPHIANEVFLPPEVIPGGTSIYTHSLDIFMLGLALAQQWFYEAATRVVETHSQRRREYLVPRHEDQHLELLSNLLGVKGSSITPLLVQMLGRLAIARPNATELLDHSALSDYIPSATLQEFRARR